MREIISSPAFNVSMFIWPLPVAVPFFISRSATSTSHDVISRTTFYVSVDYGTLFTVL